MSKSPSNSIFRYLCYHQIPSKSSPTQNFAISHLQTFHPKHCFTPWSPSSTLAPILHKPTQKSNPCSNLLFTRGFRSSPFKISDVGAKFNGKISPTQNCAISHLQTFHPKHCFTPWSPSSTLARILQNPTQKSNPCTNLLFTRGFGSSPLKISDVGAKFSGKISESVIGGAFLKHKKAIGLHIEAFWKRHSVGLLGAGAVVICIVLWRVLFGIADTFVGLSQGMAKYGFLALSTAIVSLSGLYLHSKFTIKPDKVYKMAMRKLNKSAGILEVMGAPLSGSDLRAYVTSGGGTTLRNFKPRSGNKRCFLIFPIRGSEKKGLVSVEVKNKKGQYEMKLLAVDIPVAGGPDQRLFVVGDEEEYRVGNGLISELRDPVVKAMAAAKEFEERDQIEDDKEEENTVREQLQDGAEKLGKKGSSWF